MRVLKRPAAPSRGQQSEEGGFLGEMSPVAVPSSAREFRFTVHVEMCVLRNLKVVTLHHVSSRE